MINGIVWILLALLASPALSAGCLESYFNKQLTDARKVVSVNVSDMGPGEVKQGVYLDRSIFIYRRTPEEI